MGATLEAVRQTTHGADSRFMVTPSETTKEQATSQLARVSARLEDLQEALESHLRSLGVAGIEELDEETMAEIDKLDPRSG
jgi:hypothetical protein